MKLLRTIALVCALLSASPTLAQEGAFINLHVSGLGKIDTKSPPYRDDFGNTFADTAILNNGIGGGMMLGFRFSSR